MGRVRIPVSITIVLLIALFVVTAANAETTRTQPQQNDISGVQVTASGNMPILKQHPLTTAQKQRIAELRYSSQQQIRQVQTNTSLSAQQKSARIQQIQRQTSGQIVSVLTPEQRTEIRNWQSSRRGAGMGAGTGMKPGMGAGAGMKPGMGVGTAVGVGDLTPLLKQHPLTASQKQRIITFRRQEQQKIRQINSNTSLSTQQKTTQIQQIQRTTSRQVMDVLTTAQKRELAQSAKHKMSGSMK